MYGVIYARYSSDNQTELSIHAQVRACTEYAEKKGINIIDIYTDEAMTGTNNRRPGYQSMLSDAFENKFGVILIHKYDRIARNLEEQVMLRSKLKALNIKLIAVAQDYGEGKDAELSKGIQWVLGEYYSANLAEESRKGLRELAINAKHTGGVPIFGYKIVDGKYAIDESEAYWVRRMYNIVLTGGTFPKLLEEMKQAGVKGHHGSPIVHNSVYWILRNEKYKGTYHYYQIAGDENSKIVIEDAIPAIISKEDFNRVQELLKNRKCAKVKKHRCSGLIYCKNCGSKVYHKYGYNKRYDLTYYSFYCSNQRNCHSQSIKESFLENAVDAYMAELFSDENITKIEKSLSEFAKENKSKSKIFEEDKKAKILKAEKELKNLITALASGSFNDNFEYINEEIKNKRSEIDTLKSLQCKTIPDKKVKKWLQNIKDKNYSPSIFIDKIIASKDEIEIISNFKSIVDGEVSQSGEGLINYYLPEILYKYNYQSPVLPR